MTTPEPPPEEPTPQQQAEALWLRAHESVRRGDFAAAVRDLAACFKLLQALRDPRLAEVHRRWGEVHKMALEEQAQGRAQAAAPSQKAPTLEAEAEAAANAGNLEEAIALYEKALALRPDNELVAERLQELKNARPRAQELGVTDIHTAATLIPTAAPVMAEHDAPVGMHSLEVEIDMGDSVTPEEADDLPIAADDLVMVDDDAIMEGSLPPEPAAPAAVLAESAAPVVEAVVDVANNDDDLPSAPVALLETLLARVQKNRRAA